MKERDVEPEDMTRRQSLYFLGVVFGGALLAGLASKGNKVEPRISFTPTGVPAHPTIESTTPLSPARVDESTRKLEGTPSPEKAQNVEIILTGDVLLGRTVMTESLELKDPLYPFREVGQVLRDADITFINLENPIIENCPLKYSGMVFCANPEMIEGLNFAGVDVVTLANNHSMDYREEGLAQTESFLEENGIEFTLAGRLVTKKIGGMAFGFLGFNRVGMGENPEAEKVSRQELDLVRKADPKVDVLIVAVHWGSEYKEHPSDLQRRWAKEFIEAGTDVVVGHHPHVVQDIDRIDGKPVYYSLGNLVFDNMDPKYAETRKGMVARLIYRDGQLIKEELLPTQTVSRAQPEFVK